MSDDQENEESMSCALCQTQSSKELEVQLEILRRSTLQHHNNRLTRKTARMFTKVELLKLPTIPDLSTNQRESKDELIVNGGCTRPQSKDPLLVDEDESNDLSEFNCANIVSRGYSQKNENKTNERRETVDAAGDNFGLNEMSM